MNQIIQTPSGYEVYFKYSPILVEAVKALTGRRWMDNVNGCGKRYWYVPNQCKEEIEQFAEKWKFEIVTGTETVVIQSRYDYSDVSIPEMPELNIPFEFKREPFPFQKTGVAYVLKNKRVIVGDQMGLGKTGQSIMAITAANSFPCLVICPATIKENWRREWSIWTDKRAVVLTDNMIDSWPRYFDRGLADVFIVNYESLKKYFVKEVKESKKFTMKDIKFHDNVNRISSVIIDESHRCKNSKTQQSKFTQGICEGKEFVLALTGTPVINKPSDLIQQLNIIGQMEHFGGYRVFNDMYCETKTSAALEHLNAKLRRTCFYRREKHEVLKDLPSKTRQVVYCDIDNRKEYWEAEEDLALYLKTYREKSDAEVQKSMMGEIMVRMGALKNISARGKLATVYEFVDDVLESGEKLVLFAHLKEVIHKVHARYPQAVTITGDDSHEERQQSVDRFQQDPSCQLILCSIQAAGVGITLTAASRVAFIEFAWHPAIHDQAEDRCHRIGQVDNVQCTYFAGRNTIDEQIYTLIEEKRSMTKAAIGANDPTQVSILDDVMMLFETRGERVDQTEKFESEISIPTNKLF